MSSGAVAVPDSASVPIDDSAQHAAAGSSSVAKPALPPSASTSADTMSTILPPAPGSVSSSLHEGESLAAAQAQISAAVSSPPPLGKPSFLAKAGHSRRDREASDATVVEHHHHRQQDSGNDTVILPGHSRSRDTSSSSAGNKYSHPRGPSSSAAPHFNHTSTGAIAEGSSSGAYADDQDDEGEVSRELHPSEYSSRRAPREGERQASSAEQPNDRKVKDTLGNLAASAGGAISNFFSGLGAGGGAGAGAGGVAGNRRGSSPNPFSRDSALAEEDAEGDDSQESTRDRMMLMSTVYEGRGVHNPAQRMQGGVFVNEHGERLDMENYSNYNSNSIGSSHNGMLSSGGGGGAGDGNRRKRRSINLSESAAFGQAYANGKGLGLVGKGMAAVPGATAAGGSLGKGYKRKVAPPELLVIVSLSQSKTWVI